MDERKKMGWDGMLEGHAARRPSWPPTDTVLYNAGVACSALRLAVSKPRGIPHGFFKKNITTVLEFNFGIFCLLRWLRACFLQISAILHLFFFFDSVREKKILSRMCLLCAWIA